MPNQEDRRVSKILWSMISKAVVSPVLNLHGVMHIKIFLLRSLPIVELSLAALVSTWLTNYCASVPKLNDA